MQDKSDVQLLREYARHGNEAAFREIVQRHTDLIYSAALRQVSSPDLAGEVTQAVFVDLARKAPSLAESYRENSSILGWLYRSTRFASLGLLRDERRRHERETEAMEQIVTASETSEDWSSLSPVLDEAMAELSETDREAILLRFFKNQDFQKVGVMLGVSDDTAQKRVSRALEKLRQQLTRRGATMSVMALSSVLSVDAVQAAPSGLITAVSATVAVSGTVHTAGTITAGKVLIMTTAQKAIVATTLVVAMGTALYQTFRNSELESRIQSLRQHTSADPSNTELRMQLAETERRLLAVEQENERLRQQNSEIQKLRGELSRLRTEFQQVAQQRAADSDDLIMKEAVAWRRRVESLKQHLRDNPQVGIPELQLATEDDWLNAARSSLETERDFRQAMANLREDVQHEFTSTLFDAVQKFMAANDGNFPTDVSQLRPYFDLVVDEAMLQRYAIIACSKNSSLNMGGESILTQKNAVDAEYDSRNSIGPNGYGSSSGKHAWDLQWNDKLNKAIQSIKPVVQAYAAANGGKEPANYDELLSYLTTDEQREAFERLRASRAP